MAAPGRSFATGLLALGLAACGGATGEQEPPAAPVAAANDVATPPSGKVVLSHAARSIWGVVPDPPRRKRDLQPDLIRGTAVAIAPDTLLASCQVVGDRAQVGVVRHNKYRVAEVSLPSQPNQDVCELHVTNAPLNVIGGFRSFADLREGEPLYALISRTSAEYALAEGQLAAKGAASSELLETTLTLPPGTQSAVLFDASGNLVGLGSGGPTVDSMAVAVPVPAALAPALAQRDLGPPARVAAAAVQEPPTQRQLWVWRDEERDSGHDAERLVFVGSTPATASVTSAVARPAAGTNETGGHQVADGPAATPAAADSSVEPAAGGAAPTGNGLGTSVATDSVDVAGAAAGGAAPTGNGLGTSVATDSVDVAGAAAGASAAGAADPATTSGARSASRGTQTAAKGDPGKSAARAGGDDDGDKPAGGGSTNAAAGGGAKSAGQNSAGGEGTGTGNQSGGAAAGGQGGSATGGGSTDAGADGRGGKGAASGPSAGRGASSGSSAGGSSAGGGAGTGGSRGSGTGGGSSAGGSSGAGGAGAGGDGDGGTGGGTSAGGSSGGAGAGGGAAGAGAGGADAGGGDSKGGGGTSAGGSGGAGAGGAGGGGGAAGAGAGGAGAGGGDSRGGGGTSAGGSGGAGAGGAGAAGGAAGAGAGASGGDGGTGGGTSAGGGAGAGGAGAAGGATGAGAGGSKAGGGSKSGSTGGGSKAGAGAGGGDGSDGGKGGGGGRSGGKSGGGSGKRS